MQQQQREENKTKTKKDTFLGNRFSLQVLSHIYGKNKNTRHRGGHIDFIPIPETTDCNLIPFFTSLALKQTVPSDGTEIKFWRCLSWSRISYVLAHCIILNEIDRLMWPTVKGNQQPLSMTALHNPNWWLFALISIGSVLFKVYAVCKWITDPRSAQIHCINLNRKWPDKLIVMGSAAINILWWCLHNANW